MKTKPTKTTLFFAVLLATALACSSSSSTRRATSCTPRATQICTPTSGCRGVQVCNDEGTGFSDCMCIDAGAGAAAGQGGSSGGSAGRGGASGANTGGSAGEGGSAGMSGSSGATASGGSGPAGASGSGGSAGGGRGGTGGSGGGTAGASGAMGSGTIDAGMGCDQASCLNAISTFCQGGNTPPCLCMYCACEARECGSNQTCREIMRCVYADPNCQNLAQCTTGANPCGVLYRAAPANVQDTANAWDACVSARTCGRCTWTTLDGG